MVHPLTGQTLKESDFIYLHRGGTGYAAANDQLEGKKYRPALFCAQGNKIITKQSNKQINIKQINIPIKMAKEY